MRVKLTHYSTKRDDFMVPEDSYEGWVILAAQEGRFSFSLHTDVPLIGEAGYGDLIICPPGKMLARKALEPIAFHFIEFTTQEDPPIGKITIMDIQRLASTFHYLQQARSTSHHETQKMAAHLVNDLLFIVEQERKLTYKQQHKLSDPLISQAAAYMDQHACGNELSLQKLAKQLGMDGSQLTRRFQALFGMSPVHYVTSIRLHRARVLLVETNHSLEDIAELCGYQNGFYFSRIFTKKMKISPSVFRRTYRI